MKIYYFEFYTTRDTHDSLAAWELANAEYFKDTGELPVVVTTERSEPRQVITTNGPTHYYSYRYKCKCSV